MTGFPLVLKIERAVTENFDFRFGSGVVELTNPSTSSEHSKQQWRWRDGNGRKDREMDRMTEHV